MRSLLSSIAIGILVVSELHAACPDGQAGKLRTSQWYTYLGMVHEFAPGDRLEYDFAVVPFADGTMTVGGDDGLSRTTYQVLFAGGIVSDADYGDLVPVLEYVPGSWNDVKAIFDFATRQLTLTVNGVASAPRPFLHQDATSLQSVRINHGDVGECSATTAWLDALRVVLHTENESIVLFAENFESGSPLAGIETLPFTDGGAPPATCSPADPTVVTEAPWGTVKGYYR